MAILLRENLFANNLKFTKKWNAQCVSWNHKSDVLSVRSISYLLTFLARLRFQSRCDVKLNYAMDSLQCQIVIKRFRFHNSVWWIVNGEWTKDLIVILSVPYEGYFVRLYRGKLMWFSRCFLLLRCSTLFTVPFVLLRCQTFTLVIPVAASCYCSFC